MNNRKWNRSLLIATLFAIVIAAISIGVEWNSAQNIAVRYSALGIALVLAAAVAGYALRILRFYLLLSASGVAVSLRGAALAQGVGFALSITPGSIGDLFKLQVIRERAGTSLLRAAPALVLDRTLEGAGFLVLILFSAVGLPMLHVQIPNTVPGIAAAALAILATWRILRTPRIAATLNRFISRFPVVKSLSRQAGVVSGDLRAMATPGRIVPGLLLTGLARLADGLVLLFAAQMMGISIALPIAIFVVAASGLAGGASLLPGGTGATEAAMAGLLMAVGATFATALAIALLARFCTLWLWVGLGLGEAFTCQFTPANP